MYVLEHGSSVVSAGGYFRAFCLISLKKKSVLKYRLKISTHVCLNMHIHVLHSLTLCGHLAHFCGILRSLAYIPIQHRVILYLLPQGVIAHP